jgi:hypothetical protein
MAFWPGRSYEQMKVVVFQRWTGTGRKGETDTVFLALT